MEKETNLTHAEEIDTSSRWNAPQGSHYTEMTGYGDEDIHTYKGRLVYGTTIGVLQFASDIPMIPGEIANGSTWDFPIICQDMGAIPAETIWEWITAPEPHPDMTAYAIAAAKKLELQGVRAIVGNCGFWALYQEVISKAINVPFFSSALLQVPMVQASIGKEKKVGIITADGKALEAGSALEKVSVTDRSNIVIYGMQHDPDMRQITTNSTNYNPLGLEKALVDTSQKMVREHPEVGAIVLECTAFPAHAHAIQNAVRLDVWDSYTLVNWVFAGTMRKPITGWI